MEQYRTAMKNLVPLVKPGGFVLIFSTIRENADVGHYTVNGVMILDLTLKRKEILEAMQHNGLTLLKEEDFHILPSDLNNADNFTFFIMQKNIV